MTETLLEFGRFIEFCNEFTNLLNEFGNFRLMQSALWNHYSYWFEILGEQLKSRLGIALTKFLEWKPATDADEAVVVVRKYVADALDSLEKLTSRDFSEPLEMVLRA